MKWLNRSGAIKLPNFCLVLSQAEYEKVCKKIKYSAADNYCDPGCFAMLHTFYRGDNKWCIVALSERAQKQKDPAAVPSYLAHEGEHIIQKFLEEINETSPSKEFRAYLAQHVQYELMREYNRRMQKRKVTK